ncbi:high mobility group box domain-containing protein, partial [Pilobolus umbonatus]
PEKVKRPPNAYLLFNRDMRRQLHDVNQGLSSGEISKSISRRWKQLSKEEKEGYIKEEARLKQENNLIYSCFIYNRRSKAEMEEAGLLKKLQQKSSSGYQGAKKIQKKKEADDSLPKHPMSAYLHFAKEMRPVMKKKYPQARLVEISKLIGSEWRSMESNALQMWVDVANQDKARYAREMK